jgi:hypothetical protein
MIEAKVFKDILIFRQQIITKTLIEIICCCQGTSGVPEKMKPRSFTLASLAAI